MSTSLSHLQGASAGQTDIVHTWRNETGTHLASLLTKDTNLCGIAHPGSATGSAAYGFSVTSRICFSNQTFAHETGHNQGHTHDRPDAGTRERTGTATAIEPATLRQRPPCGAVPVMECSRTSASGTTDSRVNFCSDPNLTYNGAPWTLPVGPARKPRPAATQRHSTGSGSPGSTRPRLDPASWSSRPGGRTGSGCHRHAGMPAPMHTEAA